MYKSTKSDKKIRQSQSDKFGTQKITHLWNGNTGTA